MTKRINAARFRHARLEAEADPDYIPAGVHVLKVLDLCPPFVPRLHKTAPIRCYACRGLIQPGQTIFTSHQVCPGPPYLCYSCGIGWEMHNNRLTFDQAEAIPPFAGPRSKP